MQKGFSLLNIIILVSALALGFILFKNYTTPTSQKENTEIVKIDKKEVESNNDLIKEKTVEKQKTQMEEVSALPNPDTLPTASGNIETFIPNLEEAKKEETNPGYFINEEYKYKITFPTTWSIKNSYLEDITIGTIPPKNGQGAIKIKIGQSPESTIKTMEKEVNKYSGIVELKKEKISVDNISADKLILINNASGIDTTYILFSHEKINYMISYTHESKTFVSQAEKVVNDFEFIK